MKQPIKSTLVFIALALACWGLVTTAQATGSPTPTCTPKPTATPKPTPTPTPTPNADEGDRGNGNTVEGKQALAANTTGSNNTALGSQALFSNTTGTDNSGTGFQTLFSNISGGFNTGTGSRALQSNINGFSNTATGASALMKNTSGTNNTANGSNALQNNNGGSDNTANGLNALFFNVAGDGNTADGSRALENNISGGFNTAVGDETLFNNTTGSNNIALGDQAGGMISAGSNNVDIGNFGVSDESNTIRIGTQGTQTATFIAGISGTMVAGVTVVVDANGQLGTLVSSQRFKAEIKPMDKASEAILALKPVTFLYKHELDPKGIPQFGLVAEEVEKVNPDLVARDPEGRVFTVRYEAVNAMLLNEFLKQHHKVQKLEATVADQQKKIQTVATRQQKEIEALTLRLKEQESQIQKVGAKVELNKAASKTVVNNQ